MISVPFLEKNVVVYKQKDVRMFVDLRRFLINLLLLKELSFSAAQATSVFNFPGK